jgi:hypothetical protein
MLEGISEKMIFDGEIECKPLGLSEEISLVIRGLQYIEEGLSAIGGSRLWRDATEVK